MRNLVVAAGLLLAAALVPGASAQAAVGCQCVKLGTPSACMANVVACNSLMGGVCVAPCSYSAPKATKRHRAKLHAIKRKTVRAGSQHPVKKHQVAKKPAPKKKAKKM
jgi:hypothetical protein